MRRSRPLKLLALVAAGALALSACSDPTNPETSSEQPTSAAGGQSSSAGDTASGESPGSEGGGSTEGSAASGDATASGESGSGGDEGAGTSGEPAEPGQAAANASGTLNLFMYQKPTGFFNPMAPKSGPDNEVISLMYEGLMTTTPDGEVVPLLAEAPPEITNGGKTFTYTLKEGLLWSDGEPLTSEDVLYSYMLAADPNMVDGPGTGPVLATVEGRDAYASGEADTISGFAAPDDRTFSITLTEPNVGFAESDASLYGIMPKHIVKDFDVDTYAKNPYFQKPTVGSGPFVFQQYQTDQSVHMTANPNFRYQVGVKDVYLKIVTADVATQQLQTGEIDATSVAPVDLETVEGFDGVSIQPVDTFGFVRAAWNQSQDRFADPKVKQAFLYGTDRQSLVDGALKGQAKVRNSVLGDPWVSPDLNTYPYDPEKAKQLLDEAGWDSSKPVEVAWISAGNPDRDAAAAVMQNQLKNIGINIELKKVQGSWVTDHVPTAKFDVFIYGGGDYTSNPANVIPITACQEPGKGPNNGLYCNKEWQDMVEKANHTADADERTELYKQASLIENEDPSQMWLYTPTTLWGVSDSFQGFQPTGLSYAWYEAWKWTKAS